MKWPRKTMIQLAVNIYNAKNVNINIYIRCIGNTLMILLCIFIMQTSSPSTILPTVALLTHKMIYLQNC